MNWMTKAALLVGLAVVVGCGKPGSPTVAPTTSATTSSVPDAPAPTEEQQTSAEEIAAERAKLSPADRALVEAQEWCVISSDERLGSMGAPIKLDVKGQPVFVCCAGCKKKALADPDATLKKVADLKAKAKAEKATKK